MMPIRNLYIYLRLVEFVLENVGKYTLPEKPMGKRSINRVESLMNQTKATDLI